MIGEKMSTVTDTYIFTLSVIEHGDAEISNVVVPTEPIYKNEVFDITYDVTNNGANPDTIWGHIKDEVGNVIPGTYWEETLNHNEEVTKTYPHPGFPTTGSYELTIEAGHK